MNRHGLEDSIGSKCEWSWFWWTRPDYLWSRFRWVSLEPSRTGRNRCPRQPGGWLPSRPASSSKASPKRPCHPIEGPCQLSDITCKKWEFDLHLLISKLVLVIFESKESWHFWCIVRKLPLFFLSFYNTILIACRSRVNFRALSLYIFQRKAHIPRDSMRLRPSALFETTHK